MGSKASHESDVNKTCVTRSIWGSHHQNDPSKTSETTNQLDQFVRNYEVFPRKILLIRCGLIGNLPSEIGEYIISFLYAFQQFFRFISNYQSYDEELLPGQRKFTVSSASTRVCKILDSEKKILIPYDQSNNYYYHVTLQSFIKIGKNTQVWKINAYNTGDIWFGICDEMVTWLNLGRCFDYGYGWWPNHNFTVRTNAYEGQFNDFKLPLIFEMALCPDRNALMFLYHGKIINEKILDSAEHLSEMYVTFGIKDSYVIEIMDIIVGPIANDYLKNCKLWH